MTKHTPAEAPEPTSAEVAKALDQSETGITALRAIDPDALRIWTVKGPKDQPGSTLSGVLADGKVVLLHQRASGRFTIYDSRA